MWSSVIPCPVTPPDSQASVVGVVGQEHARVLFVGSDDLSIGVETIWHKMSRKPSDYADSEGRWSKSSRRSRLIGAYYKLPPLAAVVDHHQMEQEV